jgi:hypothetical protein
MRSGSAPPADQKFNATINQLGDLKGHWVNWSWLPPVGFGLKLLIGS